MSKLHLFSQSCFCHRVPYICFLFVFPSVRIHSIFKSCYISCGGVSIISWILTTSTPVQATMTPVQALTPKQNPIFPHVWKYPCNNETTCVIGFQKPISPIRRSSVHSTNMKIRCWGSLSLVLTTSSGRILTGNRGPPCSSNEIVQVE